MSKTKVVKKTGQRGRPQGQKNFVAVTKGELTKIIKDKNIDSVVIPKTFLRSLGIDESAYPETTAPKVKSGKVSRKEEDKVEMTLEK